MRSFFAINPFGPAAMAVLSVVIGIAIGAGLAVTPFS